MADGLLGAYFGNPNIQRQGARARALAKQRDVNLLADPKTYAVVQGLLGTPPDQLGFSVLNPKYQEIKQVAEPAFYAGSLLQVAPATAPAVNRIAQAVGPRLEQTLLPAFEAAYNRGGLSREMVEAMGNQTVSPLTVYHGSPAKFNRFDRTKIGSGEGAQAYGYGHYVAETPSVAEGYRKTLSPNELIKSGQKLEYKDMDVITSGVANDIANAGGNIAKVKNMYEKMSSQKFGGDIAKKRLEVLNNLGDDLQVQKGGNLYEIDLPDEQIARMLDFDKPLMNQSKEIQALAKQYGLTDADHMGGDLIAAMDAKRPSGAELMRQSGVPGIRYLDQGSRGTNEGTSNFVVFPGNEELLTIMKRNGGLLGD